MADNVTREKTARTPIGGFVNVAPATMGAAQLTAGQKTTMETNLTVGDYVARVVSGYGNFTIVKWYKDNKVFTTYKNKENFTEAKALAYVNTMIDISGGVPAPTSVDVSPATSTLAAAATEQLTATVLPAAVVAAPGVNAVPAANQGVLWTTSDATKATVSSTGLVTAVATGSATITATTKSTPAVTDTCAVTVS